VLSIPATSALGRSFAAVLTGLCAMVAHHAARLRPMAPLLVLVHQRLVRIALRLDRLAQRWQANTLPRPRVSAGPRHAREPRADRPRCPIPTGRVWLIRLVQPTAQFTGQVQAFLANPDTQALVQAAPQAGRLLRPLCRALGIVPPPWLRLPARPRAPRKPRPAPPAPPGATPDRPLPRYIRAAARHWRKKST